MAVGNEEMVYLSYLLAIVSHKSGSGTPQSQVKNI